MCCSLFIEEFQCSWYIRSHVLSFSKTASSPDPNSVGYTTLTKDSSNSNNEQKPKRTLLPSSRPTKQQTTTLSEAGPQKENSHRRKRGGVRRGTILGSFPFRPFRSSPSFAYRDLTSRQLQENPSSYMRLGRRRTTKTMDGAQRILL